MRSKSRPPLHYVAGILIALVAAPSISRADPIVIYGGYQLTTTPSVTLRSVFGPSAAYSSTPVPLGFYDFGTGAGPINAGNASFLVARLNTVTLPDVGSSATASVRILQLAFTNRTDNVVPYSSFSPTATGSGHVTASLSPLYTALGSETITRTSATGGTFTLSYMDRILFSAEDGTELSTSPVLSITSANGTWQSTPPSGSLVIPGVNDNNFYVNSINLQNSLGNSLTLISASPSPAAVPEPPTWALFSAVLGGLAWITRKRGANLQRT